MSASIPVASTRKHRAFRARPIAASIAFALALGGATTLAYAHTASVNTVAGLKAAILAANTDGLDDVITLTSNITFVSAADAIAINVTDGKTLTIVGGGFTLSGANLARVLNITAGTVVMQNLTITKGTLSGNGGSFGAGINGGSALGAGISNAGSLTISNVTITQNTATGGGAGGNGGAGSGANGIGGGTGGGGAVGSLGNGGNGGTSGIASLYVGLGGTSAGGGAGGAAAYSAVSGGVGGTAMAGLTTIGGGGGGGSGIGGRGGIGGAAAGAIYNTGTLNVIGGSVISNNAGAGGGGGANEFSGARGGFGGRGVGGIWNQGGTVDISAASMSAMAGNFGASGGIGGVSSFGSNVGFSSPPSVNNIFTDTSTVNTALVQNRYRIYVPSTGGYLYTTDSNEYQALIKLTGTYVDDGIDHKILSQAFTASGITAIPYYRLYIKPIRQHFWTTDVNEYNVQRAKTAEFGDDGIDGYIFPTAGVPGTVPLYRLSIKGTAIHYWTTNKNEFDTLVATRVGIGEGAIGNPPGVTGYVMPK